MIGGSTATPSRKGKMYTMMSFVSIASFFCWSKKLNYRQMKAEVRINYCYSVNKSELLICLPISFSYTNWIAFTVPMLKLLNLHTVVFRQYQKNLLHSPHCIYFDCSKFKQLFGIYFFFTFHFSSKKQGSL